MSQSGVTLVLDALRHRWVTFLIVAGLVLGAGLLGLAATASRYDAVAIVGFAPTSGAAVAGDVVRISASQSAEAATSETVLSAAEENADVAPGTLSPAKVQAELVPDTGLVQLVVSDENPERAALLANELAAAVVVEAESDLFDIEVVRGAQVPTSAAAPARVLYVVAALVTGVGLGLCAVLAWEAWRPRLRSSAHLASVIGAPTVAHLKADPSAELPTQELLLAQARLTRPRSTHTGDADRQTSGLRGVAILGTEAVSPATLGWVSTALGRALTDAGTPAQVLDDAREGSPAASGSESAEAMQVQPVADVVHDAKGLATAQRLGQAIVVGCQNEPVSAVFDLSESLAAAGVEVTAGILVAGQVSTQHRDDLVAQDSDGSSR